MLATAISGGGGFVAAASRCGDPWREPCLSEADERYNPNANYDIKAQHEFWKSFEGYYECDMRAYDGNGEPMDTMEFEIPDFGAMNFTFSPHKVFNNITIDGTRSISHRYVILPPSPGESFFGLARGFDIYATSTFELDGRVVTLPYQSDESANTSADDGLLDATDDATVSYPVGNDTTFSKNYGNTDRIDFMSVTLTCLDEDCNTTRELASFFKDGNLDLFQGCTNKKLTKEEFVDGINEAYRTFSVAPQARLPVPMEGLSLNGGFPDEDAWCKLDPNCAPNPYSNPTTPVKAGVIAGFTISSVILFLIGVAAGIYIYNKQQTKRYRNVFAARVAQTMSIHVPAKQMDATTLANEFKRIDAQTSAGNTNRRASAVGNITKEGMWEFLSSGEAVEMNRSDFEALWAVMDADGSGYVDFLEFCAFMGQCHDEYDNARNDRGLMAERLSRQFSTRFSQVAGDDVDQAMEDLGPMDDV